MDGQQVVQQTLKGEAKSVFDERLNLEHEIGQNDSTLSLIEQFLIEAQALESVTSKGQFKLLRTENLKKMLETAKQQIAKASEQVKENQKKMLKLEGSTDKISSEALDKRVTLGLLEFKRETQSST